jgi:hypothetical protein
MSNLKENNINDLKVVGVHIEHIGGQLPVVTAMFVLTNEKGITIGPAAAAGMGAQNQEIMTKSVDLLKAITSQLVTDFGGAASTDTKAQTKIPKGLGHARDI